MERCDLIKEVSYETGSVKERVAFSLAERLIASKGVVTESGYYDTYDEICADVVRQGGVEFASIETHESTDVYYYFDNVIVCVRCLTGYGNDRMNFPVVRTINSAIISIFKNM